MKTVYIAGPVSNKPDGNIIAFMAAEQALDDAGVFDKIINPMNHPLSADCFAESQLMIERGQDYREGPVYCEIMRDHFASVLEADEIYVLPDWESAPGAVAELQVAKMTGKPVYEIVGDNDVRAIKPAFRVEVFRGRGADYNPVHPV